MIQKFTVVPRIPDRLTPLRTIVNNLWWSWARNPVALFRRIDMDLWDACGHNPVAMLGALHPQKLRFLQEDEAFVAHMEAVYEELDQYLKRPTWYSRFYDGKTEMRIAYFSAEFGISECLPFYSGGLGGLAGDHVKSADELGLPLVGVGLAYQKGYYRQYLNSDGWQQEHYPDNDFYNLPLTLMRDDQGAEVTVEVELPQRTVTARIWRLDVGRIPLYLLDSNLPVNEEPDREITSSLYGGDLDMRMRQEILLGVGGVRALRKLGISPTVCHMNEGHSAFLGLERIRGLLETEHLSYEEAKEAVVAGNVFTTHTPVPAGNDRFPPEMVAEYFHDYASSLGLSMETFLGLGRENPDDARESFCMTVLALRTACHANGVSELHGSISRRMWKRIWPGVPDKEIPITHVTNGVHTHTWLSDEFARLFERYMGPQWLDDPVNRVVWQRVGQIPDNELWRSKERLRNRLVTFARARLKRQLNRQGSPSDKIIIADGVLDPEVLTICFARRFATYKRAYLILQDLDRLKRILLDRDRPVQLIMAGKAHPHDHPGKEIIRQIAQLSRDAEFQHRIVFIEDYDLEAARQLMQGADVWLNTPRRPMEASGTSGMKAAVSGALNVSILDGWWCEAFTGENGWAIGTGEELEDHRYQDEMESRMLYDLLENEIVPLFYSRGPDDVPREWVERMKTSIQTICPQFNTNRMVEEYAERFYFPAAVNTSMLASERHKEARALATWKKQVREHWNQVSILSAEADTNHELEVGSELAIKVQVLLGNLRPEDITVDVFHGSLDANGEIIKGESLPLAAQNTEANICTFEGTIPCRDTGRHGFAVRVMPFHRQLTSKFDTGMVTWWSGNTSTPSEVVAEKVG